MSVPAVVVDNLYNLRSRSQAKTSKREQKRKLISKFLISLSLSTSRYNKLLDFFFVLLLPFHTDDCRTKSFISCYIYLYF